MRHHIENKIYHVEILPPKQDSPKLDEDLQTFATKYQTILDAGYCACLTDNAMGLLAFQGTELLEELELPVPPEQVMIHLNTFHTKTELHRILNSCQSLGIKYLLVISGDGSDRIPRLQPADLGVTEVEAVTSVELLDYIRKVYPDTFRMGVAFNPYEPPEHEWEKLQRKFRAGAEFIITQPLIDRNEIVTRLVETYPDIPLIVEAWMSRKLYHLLSDVVGYQIEENAEFDPIATLQMLHETYPTSGAYLSFLGLKTQLPLLGEIWGPPVAMGQHEGAGRARKIVVCIKQVPATHDAKIDPETKRIVREGVKAVLNPFDLYAIEEAVQWRDRMGGEVIVLSMGPKNAERSLREALSLGADRAILLSDRAFGGSDTWATSYVLSKAIQKIGDVDLVLCGKQAIDGDTAQVGPGIAAHLDWLQATCVMDLEEMDDQGIQVRRMHEDGYDVCRLEGPSVLTVVKGINVPRIPSLRSHRAAQNAEIPIWTPEDVGTEAERIGLDGSPTRVVKSSPPAPRHTETLRIQGEPQESARALIKELRLRSIL